MRIRHATPGDLDALVGLAAALFVEDGGTRDPEVDVGWPEEHGRPYYAGLLAEHFEQWAVARRATRTTVTAYASNAVALRFYRKQGYDDHSVTLQTQLAPRTP